MTTGIIAVVALWVGAAGGLLIGALCNAAKENEKELEKNEHQHQSR